MPASEMTHIKVEFYHHDQVEVDGEPKQPRQTTLTVFVGDNASSLAESGVLVMREKDFNAFNAMLNNSQGLPVMVGEAQSFVSVSSSKTEGEGRTAPPDVRLSSDIGLIERLKATLEESPEEPEFASDICPLVRLRPETLSEIIRKIEDYERLDELKLKRKVDLPE